MGKVTQSVGANIAGNPFAPSLSKSSCIVDIPFWVVMLTPCLILRPNFPISWMLSWPFAVGLYGGLAGGVIYHMLSSGRASHGGLRFR